MHFIEKKAEQKRIDFDNKLNIEVNKKYLKRNYRKGIF